MQKSLYFKARIICFFFQFLLAVLAVGVFAGEKAQKGATKRSVLGEGLALSSLSSGHGLALDSGLGSGLAGGYAYGSGLGLSAAPIGLSAGQGAPIGLSAGYGAPAAWSAGHAGPIDLGAIENRHITITRRIGVPVPQPIPVPVQRNIPVAVPHPVAVPVDRPYPVQVISTSHFVQIQTPDINTVVTISNMFIYKTG